MNCINFPKMFQGNSTVIKEDTLRNSTATLQSMHLLLSSEENTLFGDPAFGIKLRKYLFDQNNYILRDILIDEIYTKITTFCPQVYVDRRDIKIETIKNKLYATIACKNKQSFENNTFNLKLFEGEDSEI